MQDSYLTTILILMWCLAMTMAWTALAYIWAVRWAERQSAGQGRTKLHLDQGVILPSLVLAPVMLVLGFHLFGVNLLFPSAFDADFKATLSAAAAPAIALVITSGLARSLWRNVAVQYLHWQRQPFATARLAVGGSRESAVRRLVITKSFLVAWAQCLPWLYGELIVVEAVFNAPGLGLSAWNAARQRDHLGLVTAVAGLILLYALAVGMATGASRWLGRRLESYG